MNCENSFCIYWKKNQCALRENSLNITGSCKDCIYVDIDDELLKQEREKTLKSYDDK